MAQSRPPAGWAPTGNGGYRNPASGTVIYPDGRGGWTGVPGAPGGTAQPGAPADYGTAGVAATGAGTVAGHKVAPAGAAATGLRDAGSGQGTMSTAEKSKIFSMTPRARQLYLKSMGYRVSVDGKSGPQTASAAWSFVHGHSPSWFNNQSADWQQSIWNQHFAQFHQPSKDDTGGAAPQTGTGKQVDANNHTPQDAGNQQFSGTDPSSSLGSDLGTGIADLYKLASSGTLVNSHLADNMGTMLDPKAAGAAAAEAQYGQTLRDQQRQVRLLPLQAKQHQADLTSWWGQVGDKNTEGGAADAAMADSLIGSSTGATAGVINALGGSANPSAGDLGAAGENETATLRALKLAGTLGNNDMAAAIAAQGAGQQAIQQITDANALTYAQNQVYDTQKQYGAAQTQAQNDAIGQNNALAQARLQARLGIIGQNNSLVDSRAQRLAGALSAEEGAAALGPDIAYKSALAAKALAPSATANPNLPKNQAKGAWVNLNGTQRQKLSQTAITSVQAGVKAKDTVPNIVSKVVNYYRSQGLHPANNPQVAQAILGALQAGGIQPQKGWAITKWAGLG